MVSQESIHEFMHRRLTELDSAIDHARSNLTSLENERDLVSKIIRDYRLQKSGPTDPEGPGRPERSGGSAANIAIDNPGSGVMTIKEMAMAVIQDHPDGLGNAAIFEAIRAKFGVEVQPKSLSPQLGRLADKSNIVKEKGVWKLAQKNAG